MAKCTDGLVLADGRCQRSGEVTCSGERVAIGDRCVECDAREGKVYEDADGGRCVCDSAYGLVMSEDGSCRPEPALWESCPSKIFSYTKPPTCMETCPMTMEFD